MRRALAGPALVVAVTMVLAGCGEPVELTDDEAAALATITVDDLSGGEQRCLLDGLVESDIDPVAVADGTLDEDQDATLLAVTLECIDDPARIPSFVESFIAGAAEEGVALTEEEARCAIESLGSDDASAAIAACVDDETVGDAAGYGDDEVLDLLWDGCTAGNDQMCDELFRVAPPGTAYADQGRTCAGRMPDSAGFECFG